MGWMNLENELQVYWYSDRRPMVLAELSSSILRRLLESERKRASTPPHPITTTLHQRTIASEHPVQRFSQYNYVYD